MAPGFCLWRGGLWQACGAKCFIFRALFYAFVEFDERIKALSVAGYPSSTDRQTRGKRSGEAYTVLKCVRGGAFDVSYF